MFILSSANAFNLDQSENLSFGKKFNDKDKNKMCLSNTNAPETPIF